MVTGLYCLRQFYILPPQVGSLQCIGHVSRLINRTATLSTILNRYLVLRTEHTLNLLSLKQFYHILILIFNQEDNYSQNFPKFTQNWQFLSRKMGVLFKIFWNLKFIQIQDKSRHEDRIQDISRPKIRYLQIQDFLRLFKRRTNPEYRQGSWYGHSKWP